VAILLQRAISWVGLKNRSIETLTTGDQTMLLRDGRLLLDGMRKTVLSREKVFTALRVQGIQHLGQVTGKYLENLPVRIVGI